MKSITKQSKEESNDNAELAGPHFSRTCTYASEQEKMSLAPEEERWCQGIATAISGSESDHMKYKTCNTTNTNNASNLRRRSVTK